VTAPATCSTCGARLVRGVCVRPMCPGPPRQLELGEPTHRSVEAGGPRLLRRLVQDGLRRDAVEAAAVLVAQLEEDAVERRDGER
jgi:hypothetical protein